MNARLPAGRGDPGTKGAAPGLDNLGVPEDKIASALKTTATPTAAAGLDFRNRALIPWFTALRWMGGLLRPHNMSAAL
jgi:hypothetical protein